MAQAKTQRKSPALEGLAASMGSVLSANCDSGSRLGAVTRFVKLNVCGRRNRPFKAKRCMRLQCAGSTATLQHLTAR